MPIAHGQGEASVSQTQPGLNWEDTSGPSGWLATKGSKGRTWGHSLRVSDHPSNPCLLHRKVKGARHPGGPSQAGKKVLMGLGQSLQLRPEVETNVAEEGQEGYRDRSKGERDTHIQGGFQEKAVRQKKHTHPEWCFKQLTRSNIIGG